MLRLIVLVLVTITAVADVPTLQKKLDFQKQLQFPALLKKMHKRKLQVCRDDAGGDVAAAGASCSFLKNSFGCDLDLSTLNDAQPVGTLVKMMCPVTCDVCETGLAPPIKECKDDAGGGLAAAGTSCSTMKTLGCDLDLNTMDDSIPVGTLVKMVCPLTCNSCEEADVAPAASCLRSKSLPLECFEHDNKKRCYYIYRPANLPTDRPVPLVVFFHGLGACTDDMIGSFTVGWKELAEKEGFIVLYPQGLDKHSLSGIPVSPNWNAGPCCDMGQATDDFGFTKKLISNYVQNGTVDPSKVYMAGHSNGCGMAQYMAARASDIVSGVICHAWGLLVEPSSDYAAVPIVVVHGDSDLTTPYDGRLFFGSNAVENLENWRTLNKCPDTMVETEENGFGISSYQNCAGGTSVSLITIPDEDHYPFSVNSPGDTTQLAWKVFHETSKQSNLKCTDTSGQPCNPNKRRLLFGGRPIICTCA